MLRRYRKRAGPDPETVIALIEQYRDDNPGTWMESTTAKLSTLADEALGPSSDLARLLSAALPHQTCIRDTLNEQRNYSGLPDARARLRIKQLDQSNQQALDHIIANTDPNNEPSLVQAITDFNELEHIHDLKDGFFAALRKKLSYSKRGDYLRHVCALEHLFLLPEVR